MIPFICTQKPIVTLLLIFQWSKISNARARLSHAGASTTSLSLSHKTVCGTPLSSESHENSFFLFLWFPPLIPVTSYKTTLVLPLQDHFHCNPPCAQYFSCCVAMPLHPQASDTGMCLNIIRDVLGLGENSALERALLELHVCTLLDILSFGVDCINNGLVYHDNGSSAQYCTLKFFTH